MLKFKTIRAETCSIVSLQTTESVGLRQLLQINFPYFIQKNYFPALSFEIHF